MRYYSNGSINIAHAKNGFFITTKGTIEQQQDNMDNIYVFEDLAGVLKFIKEKFKGATLTEGEEE